MVRRHVSLASTHGERAPGGELSGRAGGAHTFRPVTFCAPSRCPLTSYIRAEQASTTNKPDALKSKEEKVAEKSSSAVKSFVSGGVGGIAAVLVGQSEGAIVLS